MSSSGEHENSYETKLKKLLREVQDGKTEWQRAFEQLKALPFSDLHFAKVDHHRSLRKGFPEVIYCPGKTTDQVTKIAAELLREGQPVMITRASEEVFAEIRKLAPNAQFNRDARIVLIQKEKPDSTGFVLVISAGTADLTVAEEAASTCEAMGNRVDRLFDVGVAGIHRLLAHQEILSKARVIIVVAGMEGALPSIVGGLVSAPIIAVPTSIGYGASFGGLAPLLTMLNTCSPGIAVVNIDNGFGAGYIAGLINRLGAAKAEAGE
jgi:NCAIR mutase (PurE)-related protein